MRTIVVISFVAFALTLSRPAAAQGCTEDAAARRFCGASLVGGLGGPAGFGASGDCLGPNDDGSSGAIDITPYFPRGLRFFGGVYTSIYVNTNGNITFDGPLGTYTPAPFPVASQPMIAPYWADVDIREAACTTECRTDCETACRNPADNGVWWDFSPGRAVFTWDDVNYYRCHSDRRMSFQLVLSAAPEGCGGGDDEATDFEVEFRFARCEWETGDASGGSMGFGGTPGQSGFDAGNEADFVMIPGSREAGIARHLCQESNVGERGIWRFLVRDGVVTCPDAGEECSIEGAVGQCAIGRTSCVGGGTVCAPQFRAETERCDNFDNDCDGSVDEGGALCEGLAVCVAGHCVDPCFEGGCVEGETCTSEGICVESACVDVRCARGERCEGGRCIAGCDGVSCPVGRSCLAGRCIDACASVSCDPACEVCEAGACVPRCEEGHCADGERCGDEGRCVAAACGSSCPEGTRCGPRGCVDPCEGARCPSGEACMAGECVSVSMGHDAGPPMPRADAGRGARPGLDGGVQEDEEEGGTTSRGSRGARGGCSVSSAQSSASDRPVRGGLLVLALALTLARGRRRIRRRGL